MKRITNIILTSVWQVKWNILYILCSHYCCFVCVFAFAEKCYVKWIYVTNFTNIQCDLGATVATAVAIFHGFFCYAIHSNLSFSDQIPSSPRLFPTFASFYVDKKHINSIWIFVYLMFISIAWNWNITHECDISAIGLKGGLLHRTRTCFFCLHVV